MFLIMQKADEGSAEPDSGDKLSCDVVHFTSYTVTRMMQALMSMHSRVHSLQRQQGMSCRCRKDSELWKCSTKITLGNRGSACRKK
jgi:hypothetical protein